MTESATFKGRSAVEHGRAAADAVRAINHLTYDQSAFAYPADAWRTLTHLARATIGLQQASGQIATLIARAYGAGRIGIDPATPYADVEHLLVPTVTDALGEAAELADRLGAALARAADPLTYAHALERVR